ncbi:MAG TPA: hypothetical protein PL167_12930, partial [Cyclobacteriaceae bacterium]|nr:hypothetical protein [Cyclobacteriaceae bacterium]
MRLFSIVLLALISGSAFGQSKDYSKDTRSVESTVLALYDVISGEPGSPRNWDRFKNLFKPEARLIPTRKDDQGNLTIKAMTPDEYVQLFSSRISTGFFERELSRKVEEYGTVIHVFSTYETKEKKDGPVTNRGINSIQLFKDKDRYYVVNIFWCAESMGF